MSYRLANSLVQLRSQINAAFPTRDRSSDGWIGDVAHKLRKSDHNPNKFGVVCALDIDEDLNSCVTLKQVVDAICASRDPRVNYIIYEGQITVAGSQLQRWKKYTGKNAHKQHAHISVHQDPALYDSAREWHLNVSAPTSVTQVPSAETESAEATEPHQNAHSKPPINPPPVSNLSSNSNSTLADHAGASAQSERAEPTGTALSEKFNLAVDKANDYSTKFDVVSGVVSRAAAASDSVKSLWTVVWGKLIQVVMFVFAFAAGVPFQYWAVIAAVLAAITLLYLFRQTWLGALRIKAFTASLPPPPTNDVPGSSN